MKINGILILDATAICFVLIFFSQTIDVYARRRFGKQYCSTDDDCNYDRLCSTENINDRDVKYCMQNCRYFHREDTICRHPTIDYYPECDYSHECAANEICLEHKHKCVHACTTLTCGPNAFCTLVDEHVTTCRCLEGYTGNPYRPEGCA